MATEPVVSNAPSCSATLSAAMLKSPFVAATLWPSTVRTVWVQPSAYANVPERVAVNIRPIWMDPSNAAHCGEMSRVAGFSAVPMLNPAAVDRATDACNWKSPDDSV